MAIQMPNLTDRLTDGISTSKLKLRTNDKMNMDCLSQTLDIFHF